MELHVTALEIRQGVAIVRLNRPERGNSWTTRMNVEYRWLMQQADDNPEVKVIVVTGAGRQFCVGADFRALDHYEKSDKDYVQSHQETAMANPGYGVNPEFDHELVWHWGLNKTVIAGINGACAGIAMALVAFCDLRYAAAGAKLTTATARMGLPAEYGLSWVLPRIVGLSRAAEMLLTGRIFKAEETLAMGFLNAVFPAETFEEKLLEVAFAIAESVSPLSAQAAKRQLYGELINHHVGHSVERSRELTGALMKQADFSEGLAAMKAKRLPQFAGLTKRAG